MISLGQVHIGRIDSATAITGADNRWIYSIRPIQVQPTNIYSDPGEITSSSSHLAALPGLNLAEMENTASTTRGYATTNIPASFDVEEAEGMVIYFPAFMIFDTAANANPEMGCLFFSINAIDGGCE